MQIFFRKKAKQKNKDSYDVGREDKLKIAKKNEKKTRTLSMLVGRGNVKIANIFLEKRNKTKKTKTLTMLVERIS